MPATKFDKPIFPGAKLVSATVTVTNTSGSYSNTFQDERIATSMKADRIEVGDPSIFNDKISITTGDGSFTIACNSVAGSTSVTVSFLKIADDPTEVTSTEFDILNNRIGDLSSLSTTAKTNAVAAINENKQAITSNTEAIAALNSKFTQTRSVQIRNISTVYFQERSGFAAVQNGRLLTIQGYVNITTSVSEGTEFATIGITSVDGSMCAIHINDHTAFAVSVTGGKIKALENLPIGYYYIIGSLWIMP